jgi:ferredoxin
MCRIARLRRVLPGGRLHVLDSGRGPSPFGRIRVDSLLCIGCKECVSKGPDGCFLDWPLFMREPLEAGRLPVGLGVRAALVVSPLATLVIGVYPEPLIHSVN